MVANRKTPGVYTKEVARTTSSSFVQQATAVAGFVGYTEKAINEDGEDLTNKVVRIKHLADFEKYFGGAPKPIYGVSGDSIELTSPEFSLYKNLLHFYENGGGLCYIVSVGAYEKESVANQISYKDLLKGLETFKRDDRAKIICIPESIKLEESECYRLYKEMLKHCVETEVRFAVIDVYEGDKEISNDAECPITRFRSNIDVDTVGTDYAAAYYPYLQTSVISTNDLGYWNVTEELLQKTIGLEGDDFNRLFTTINPDAEEYNKLKKSNDVNAYLMAKFPAYVKLLKQIARKENLLGSAAGVAGIYCTNDRSKGVQNSPGGFGITGKLPFQISDEEQAELNVHELGTSINAIRDFGSTKIWGVRTIKGISVDWRYIGVRRAMLMIRESIKKSIKQYIFSPNTSDTWLSVKASCEMFLRNLLRDKVLAGESESDAFLVEIGLGETMEEQDILDGIMKLNIKVAFTRPAEFIEINFEQIVNE
ncbi:MAG: hypothetical protein N4A49_14635 [Marinifilaceae bacterium]|jgi:phage tail sheath protein FI|nr:hypothetical protein [Marinifilaceae bacterium]